MQVWPPRSRDCRLPAAARSRCRGERGCLPDASIAGTAARLMRRAAWKLRLKVASHCSSVISRKLVRACNPPALVTMASMRPCCSSTVAITRSGAAGSVRSAWTAVTRAAGSVSIGSRSTPTTMAPSSVSRRALARPMPEAAPVTITTLSVSCRSMVPSGMGSALRAGRRSAGSGESEVSGAPAGEVGGPGRWSAGRLRGRSRGRVGTARLCHGPCGRSAAGATRC